MKLELRRRTFARSTGYRARKVSVLAQTGLTFDLSTSSGKLTRTIMAGLAEFERELTN
jgi:DNA invertase Pin-like site-specific DNA recombinase